MSIITNILKSKTITTIQNIVLLTPSYFIKYWQERKTYRTQLLLMFISSIVGFIQFGLLGHFLRSGESMEILKPYGGDIIGFMVTGAIGSTSFLSIMNSPKQTIQEEQRTGTLELVCCSEVGLECLIGVRMLLNIISSFATGVVIVSGFFVIFGVKTQLNIYSLLIVITVGSIIMGSIGICSAGYTLCSKSGEPFTWVVTTIMGLFSGVLFPIELYPDWILYIVRQLPTTQIMTALRFTTMGGASLQDTFFSLLPTLVIACIGLPISIKIYMIGMTKARRDGSLGNY